METPSCDQQDTETTSALQMRLEGHRAWLSRLINSKLGPIERREEVLQDVFLAFLESQPSLPEQEERYWLCRVTLNRCAHVWREHHRKQQTPLGETRSAEGDPIFVLLQSERQELIQLALQDLVQEDRDLLIAKYLKRETYCSLSERLGLAKHQIEYRLISLKKKLRRSLIKHGFDSEELA